mmetsp:Transcript_950/g.3165  ORF Transcript_950/g.3165 Transcript_950/m.3165 type:complete len:82 (+) Transcript_950:1579-1824(+)|eukprot:scaffold8111_cov110-Isochrysis_galbana.AAC.5
MPVSFRLRPRAQVHHNSYLGVDTGACPDTMDANQWEEYIKYTKSLHPQLRHVGYGEDAPDGGFDSTVQRSEAERVPTYSYG